MADHLRQGTLLLNGKYRIVRFIKSGGFGCTYEAENTYFEERVAIKEFFVRDFCNRDENTAHITVGTQGKKGLVEKLKSKFIDEAKALYRLRHPGIVHVSDIFEENGTAYYVMDYIDGCSLDVYLQQNGPLPEAEALGYIRQVCEALKYVHAQNRLHLDLKPGNIMLAKDSGKAILIDFGTAKQYDECSGENTSTLLGSTPGYAPPEQTNTKITQFFPATDIYSLGATLYKLLTGITPLTANERSSGDELEPLPDSVSEPTSRAVEQALLLPKLKRPQSIDAFLEILNADSRVSEGEEVEPDADTTEICGEDESAPKEEVIAEEEAGGLPDDEAVEITGDETMVHSGSDGQTDHSDSSIRSSEPFAKPKKKSRRWVWWVSAAVILISVGVWAFLSREAGTHNGYEWVDLGLPSGLKWATCNVGASSPEESGDFFIWRLADKAVAENWGGDWRMPTKEDFQELMDMCYWEWKSQGGKYGYEVTGPSGKSIFLPATWVNCGEYWTSSSSVGSNSYFQYFDDESYWLKWGDATGSHNLRPVLDK